MIVSICNLILLIYHDLPWLVSQDDEVADRHNHRQATPIGPTKTDPCRQRFDGDSRRCGVISGKRIYCGRVYQMEYTQVETAISRPVDTSSTVSKKQTN